MKFLKGDKVMVMGDPNTIGTVEAIVDMNGEFKAIVDLGGYCSDQWIRNRTIYVSKIICDFSSIKRVSA